MPLLQVVARLPSTTGVAEDTAENVFHIGYPVTWGAPEFTDVFTALGRFYNLDNTNDPVAYYLSAGTSRVAGACSFLAYSTDDYSGATPFGAPVASTTWTLGAAANASQLPDEVAVVLSYHGDLTGVPVTQANPTPPPATIRPQQRRRGRLFLGPLGAAAGAVVNGHLRPTANLRTDLGVAFDRLQGEIDVIDPPVVGLGVWSRADEALWPVVGGYVDDAWDTQRRRGLAPTTRTPFTI